MSNEIVYLLSPEIILVVAALTIYLGGAMVRAERPWAWVAGAAVVLAALALGRCCLAANGSVGPLMADPWACYARWLALAVGAILTLLSWRPFPSGGTTEYLGSLLLAIAGWMIVAMAGNLVLLFVGLELISIPTYILLYLGRRDAAAQESAAKYFFLSILASAMLLYGFSFLYGVAGSTNLADIRAAFVRPEGLPAGFAALAKVALVLILAGLCFRVTAVPFHFYAADVYQGTTHANAAFLSVVPKAAGLVVMVRLLLVAMPGVHADAWPIVAGIAALTMTLGNLLALWQDNLRRLMAYSSIANAGYMLMGLAVGLATSQSPSTWDGIAAMFFYLTVYALATIGLFAVLAYLGRQKQPIEVIDELAGVGRDDPLAGALLGFLLFSLTGLPPLAGLWGKFFVFGSALTVQSPAGGTNGWFVALAVVGGLNAAIAAFYYLRIIGVVYFRPPLGVPRPEGGRGAWLAAVACAVLVLAIGLYPGPLMKASGAASPADQQGPQLPVPPPSN